MSASAIISHVKQWRACAGMNKGANMTLNNEQLKDLIHQAFILTWHEARIWPNRKYTAAEVSKIEFNIRDYIINAQKIKRAIK